MGESPDNQRLVVTLADGLAVETVAYPGGTLCLSSQAGCAVGCPFCASGKGGLRRNLSPAELQAQVDFARRRGIAPRRLALAGIGEPLHNWDAVRTFLAASELPVSLTTSGGSPERLAAALGAGHNGLMLSLHAGTPALHRRLLPGAPPLEALAEVLAATAPRLSRRARRKFGVNYLLLAGLNDHRDELDRLLALLAPWPEATLHLLTCNPVPGSVYRSPEPARVAAVHHYLARHHPHVRRANRWRRQADGGCGTLVLRRAAPKAPQEITT